MNIQAKVALDKEKHPEQFCPTKKCLWRTGGGQCPRHKGIEGFKQEMNRVIEKANVGFPKGD